MPLPIDPEVADALVLFGTRKSWRLVELPPELNEVILREFDENGWIEVHLWHRRERVIVPFKNPSTNPDDYVIERYQRVGWFSPSRTEAIVAAFGEDQWPAVLDKNRYAEGCSPEFRLTNKGRVALAQVMRQRQRNDARNSLATRDGQPSHPIQASVNTVAPESERRIAAMSHPLTQAEQACLKAIYLFAHDPPLQWNRVGGPRFEQGIREASAEYRSLPAQRVAAVLIHAIVGGDYAQFEGVTSALERLGYIRRQAIVSFFGNVVNPDAISGYFRLPDGTQIEYERTDDWRVLGSDENKGLRIRVGGEERCNELNQNWTWELTDYGLSLARELYLADHKFNGDQPTGIVRSFLAANQPVSSLGRRVHETVDYARKAVASAVALPRVFQPNSANVTQRDITFIAAGLMSRQEKLAAIFAPARAKLAAVQARIQKEAGRTAQAAYATVVARFDGVARHIHSLGAGGVESGPLAAFEVACDELLDPSFPPVQGQTPVTAEPDRAPSGSNAAAAVSDDSHLSSAKLAELFHVPHDPLRNRLNRWRKRNHSGWIENSERGPRDAKYLYRVGAIRLTVEQMRDQRNDQRATSEKKKPR